MSNLKHSKFDIIDTFYVLDFDRCLGNTNKLDKMFLSQITERDTGINPDTVYAARLKCEQGGESFDTAAYVRNILSDRGDEGERTWSRLEQAFIQSGQQEDMLEPSAADLLRILQDKKCRFGIVTYGGDIWQLAKMAAAGLIALPHVVTPIKEKGRLLGSWQMADGSFLIPTPLAGGQPVIAKKLVFIDDKPVSFSDLPVGVDAICALSPDAVWSADVLAMMPARVRVVSGLSETIELLFGHEQG